ncbi:PhzF family phenazine biosynthesis isomerase [candidate division WOR-3 bacterium]|uniref:PhzF family phenazine biosynthesis isomerase n=1 Tax=candidate division WOR-3 bacterium TaxID=2052148 RepID=A0A9D5KCF2_UNCW3|nr:PhzF family phenazine biosynthesis isomerase [candidate division WOR-3 bacterium]MBD3365515.1 PhzF family phenazine biosynthesis isomerase [candidate division WOR-3 bacterium]
MGIPIYQVDSFTAEVFKGNPAAVCILADEVSAGWMQGVAAEMNLSETAFLFKKGTGFSLRWFTPKVEVDLCGHATLASAHVLWEQGYLAPGEEARFYTASGLLEARRKRTWIELDFPAQPEAPLEESAYVSATLTNALGTTPSYLGKNEFAILAGYKDEKTIRQMKPDIELLGTLPGLGVIVTAPCEGLEYDFVSRFFAPGAGIDEDPVTGAAHCCLGPYWAAGLGKKDLVGYQASQRGGVVRVKVTGDRVILGGQAVTVLRGELTI